ncbi:NADPH-dependent F420 reductase [Nocardioides sp.]|uniref:NADPH-dependent F420 reductase n=1 Tax=Nocardioides sp. TaxID=35761 RepID=UPI0035652886
MRIAVIGTGNVGRTLAGGFAARNHEVVIATRDPGETAARDEYAAWAAAHPSVELVAFADVSDAEVVANAVGGKVCLEALAQVGAGLDDVVLLDLSNPLDFSAGYPPSLFVKDDDSLGEQIQRAHPGARVVKSLNTLNFSLMVDPEDKLGETTSVFLSGDDEAAKDVVRGLLTEFGHRDVIDLGALSTARGTEMWLPLFMRVAGALDTLEFNLRIVRS